MDWYRLNNAQSISDPLFIVTHRSLGRPVVKNASKCSINTQEPITNAHCYYPLNHRLVQANQQQPVVSINYVHTDGVCRRVLKAEAKTDSLQGYQTC